MGGSEHDDDADLYDPVPAQRVAASRTMGFENIAADIYNAVKNHELELNRATAAFEHAALRPGILLNGGAAVAFAAMLGAVAKAGSGGARVFGVIDPGQAAAAVLLWTMGLVLAALATGFGWRSQMGFSRVLRGQRAALEFELAGNGQAANAQIRRARKEAGSAKWNKKLALAFAGSSYVAFVAGVLAALGSIVDLAAWFPVAC